MGSKASLTQDRSKLGMFLIVDSQSIKIIDRWILDNLKEELP